jgi:hypothetical protein
LVFDGIRISRRQNSSKANSLDLSVAVNCRS